MKLRVITLLALRNLWSHRLRTILTVLGVTIGVGSIIFLVSLGYGLERLVTSQVANFSAFSIIDIPSATTKNLKINQAIIDKISSIQHIQKVASVSNLAGRINKKDSDSTAEVVIIAGNVEYWQLGEVSVDKGNLPGSAEEVVVNQSVLKMIGEDKDTIVGKTINLELIIPNELQDEQTGNNVTVSGVPLKIVGTQSDDSSPIVLVDLSLLAKNKANNYSALKIKIDKPDKEIITTVRKQVENIGFTTEYVGDTVSEINKVFSLFRVILGVFGLIALIVAALGTFNTLTISLLERIREVGLFKALGMRNKEVYKLFLAESLIIGVLGGILGLILGGFLGQGINFIFSIMAKRANVDAIQLFITPWFFALGVAFFSIVVGFLTGWYPSKRAVKIDPLDALRYE